MPTFRPGDIVIMHNLGSHKAKAVHAALRQADASLFFLPSYSLDFNPIEQVLAKLKHLLPRTAERSIIDSWRRIGQLLNRFSADKCNTYIFNAGYALA